MKVLFLTNIPSPYRVDFFNELGKLCELTVVYERNSASDRDRKWVSSNAVTFEEIYLKSMNIKDDNGLDPRVIRYLKKDKFDVIVVGGYSTPTAMLAILIMRLKKIPYILNADGGFIRCDRLITFVIKRFFIGGATTWLSTGGETNKYLQHYGADLKRIYTYPFTSIYTEDILAQEITKDQKEKLKEQLGIADKKVVISIGQFIHRKGFDLLLKAWEHINQNIQDASLYIIGGEPTKDYIDLVQSRGLKNVNFIGFKTKQELIIYFRIADIFVLPTREDIWGLVINEAMAFGLPVITTDKCIAGLELIEDGVNGFLVPSDDSDTLAKRMRELLDDDILLRNASRNSLKKIKDYTIQNMALKHMDIFGKTV